MIYSCFNEKAGHYEYFEDDRALAMNGDFPVPQLQRLQAGRVGVPARDAGRSLPRDAKRTGTGWQARGAIVQCKNTPMRGLMGFGVEEWKINPLGPRFGVALMVFIAGVGAVFGGACSYIADGEILPGAAWGAVAIFPASFVGGQLKFTEPLHSISALCSSGVAGVYGGGGDDKAKGAIAAGVASVLLVALTPSTGGA
jgi:hypothetical protein